MLPVLPAERRVRAGPRGSGPGAKRRRPCPPLCAAAAKWRRDEGRPEPSTPGLRPGSNKGLDKGINAQGRRTRAVQGAKWGFPCPQACEGLSGLPRGSMAAS